MGQLKGKTWLLSNIKVKTANGKIMMDAIKSQIVEAETANGSIQFSSAVIDEIDAETLNGAIKLEGDFRKAELQSFNGNIQCKAVGSRCEVIEAKTTTGIIDIYVPEFVAVNGELKSNLGNFTVDLDGIQVVEDKSELIAKNNEL